MQVPNRTLLASYRILFKKNVVENHDRGGEKLVGIQCVRCGELKLLSLCKPDRHEPQLFGP